MLKNALKIIALFLLPSFSNAQNAYIEYQDDSCEILIHVGCPKGEADKTYLDAVAGRIKKYLQETGHTIRLAFREAQPSYQCNKANLNTDINSIIELNLFGDEKFCMGFYRKMPGKQMIQQDLSEAQNKLKEYSTITTEGKYLCSLFSYSGIVAAFKGLMKAPLLQCNKTK